MTLEQAISALVGTALGARSLDSNKPMWARAAYAAVGFDMWRAALGSGITEPLVGTRTLGTRMGDAKNVSHIPMPKMLPSGQHETPIFERRTANTITERVSHVHEQAVTGTKDPVIYKLARDVISRKCGDAFCIKEKDHVGEAKAIFDEAKKRVRYVWDPTDYDAFQTPRKTLQLAAGDCVPATSLVLTAGYIFKPIGEVTEGDTIMGDGQWTKVTKFWEKGEKKLLAFTLNNGCVLRCTPEHKLFVIPRAKNKGSGQRADAVEKRARDVKPGDDLLTPERLPTGRESIEAEKAWLLGVFIADGWSEACRASISGKDGHPKEAQKKRVQAICEKLGIPTYWHARYISINNAELAKWLAAGGKGALNKHVPSLDLDEPTLRAVLTGLEADSGVTVHGTRVYSTISPELALQLRVMFRMLGQSVSIVKVDDHGGLGTHPIYRITVRGGTKMETRPHARVKSVVELPAERVVDIETDTHRFYLPESDTIVHNCDDAFSLLAALLRSIGLKVRSRVVQTTGEATWNHIYLLVFIPETNKWMPLDLTVDKPAGWEVPKSMIVKVQDFDIVER